MDKQNQGFPESRKPALGGTQAVARAAALLRELAAIDGSGSSLVELAERSGLERPTTYRILQRLVFEGLVEQDPATRGYALGPLLYELGLAAKPPRQLLSLANGAAGLLAKESGDTVFAIIQSGMDSVCIDRQEGDYPVKALMMNPGRRRPMGIGAGSLALLGAMPSPKAEQILETNATRIRVSGGEQIGVLQQAIEAAHAKGYALRAANEAPEILSLAVAATNGYGIPVLALSISALKFRIEHRFDFLLSLLNEGKRSVEHALRERAIKVDA